MHRLVIFILNSGSAAKLLGKIVTGVFLFVLGFATSTFLFISTPGSPNEHQLSSEDWQSNNSNSIWNLFHKNPRFVTESNDAKLHQHYVKILNHSTFIGYNYNYSNVKFQPLLYLNQSVSNIYFIKVHKTGSTTLQNMLYRYGHKHNLTFSIFRCGNAMPFPNPAYQKYFADPEVKHCNIVLDHALYKEQAYTPYMAKDTKVISLIRHPLMYLESIMGFNYLDRHFGLTQFKDPIRTFLTSPYQYDRKHRWVGDSWNCLPVNGPSFTKNAMAYHFGYEKQFDDSQNSIEKFLNNLESKLSFVLVLEKFDESLVLLKRIFKMEFRDIMYFPLGSLKYHGRKNYHNLFRSRQELRNMTSLHRQWAPADYAIYEHFSRKLENILSNQHPEFWTEVTHFKKVLSKFQNFCKGMCDKHNYKDFDKLLPIDIRNELLSHKITFPRSNWHSSFEITYLDCVNSIMGTTEYHEATKYVQMPRLCKDKKADMNYCNTSERVTGIFTKNVIYKKLFQNNGKCQKEFYV